MSMQLATTNETAAAIIEQVVINGDLAQLSPEQRVNYYRSVCDSVGLNPLTRPFDYITLNGKLTLYAKKDATDQLRRIHGISIDKIEREVMDDVLVVTVYASTKDSRHDSDIGAVTIGNLKGDKRANAIMKALTKAKRRVTLSIAGLGWLDEMEIETIPQHAVQHAQVNAETGEIAGTVVVESNGWLHGDIWSGWKTKDDALHWACTDVTPLAFKHEKHALNAFNKLRDTLTDGLAEDETLKSGVMFDAWVEDVYRRSNEDEIGESGDDWLPPEQRHPESDHYAVEEA